MTQKMSTSIINSKPPPPPRLQTSSFDQPTSSFIDDVFYEWPKVILIFKINIRKKSRENVNRTLRYILASGFIIITIINELNSVNAIFLINFIDKQCNCVIFIVLKSL